MSTRPKDLPLCRELLCCIDLSPLRLKEFNERTYAGNRSPALVTRYPLDYAKHLHEIEASSLRRRSASRVRTSVAGATLRATSADPPRGCARRTGVPGSGVGLLELAT